MLVLQSAGTMNRRSCVSLDFAKVLSNIVSMLYHGQRVDYQLYWWLNLIGLQK